MKRIVPTLLLLALLLGGCAPAGTGERAAPAPAPPAAEEADDGSDVSASDAAPYQYGRRFLDGATLDFYDALYAAASGFAFDAALPVPAALDDSELARVLDMVQCDNPRLYWLEPALTGTDGARFLTLGTGNLSREEVLARDAQLLDTAAELLAHAEGLDDRAAAYALHDALIERSAYTRDSSLADIGNPYGALVRGRAVCDGFARSYQLLLQLRGIDCVYIRGTSHRAVLHAWNAVRLDGAWSYTDVTWDRVASSPGMITHEYLCVTGAEIDRQHYPDSGQYPTLPDADSPGDNYYIASGMAVEPDFARLRAQLAEAFAAQLPGQELDERPRQIYLELKIVGGPQEYQRARDVFIKSLYDLLADFNTIALREGWSLRVRTVDEIQCSFNDEVQVLVLYPWAWAE